MKNLISKNCVFLLLPVAALAFWATSARASLITNTFTGVVIAADQFGDTTTLDIGKDFSTSASTSLVGDTFTLIMTTDTTRGSHQGTSYITGGTYPSYNGTDPYTSISLTIDSLPKKFTKLGNSGDAGFVSGPDGSVGEQAFTYSPVNQGEITESVNVNLNSVIAGSLAYNKALPSMLLSNGDFANYYSFMQDSTCAGCRFNSPEEVVFQVQAVNYAGMPSTPEPSSLLLVGTGLFAIAGIARMGVSRSWLAAPAPAVG